MSKDLASRVVAVPQGGVPTSTAPCLISFAVDPTAGAGVPAPIGSIGMRTDIPLIYSKIGAPDTAWLAGAGFGAGYRETAVSTTIDASADSVVVVIGAAGAVTISLPAANTAQAGRRYTIKDGDGASGLQPITVDPAGADTIDGDTAAIINLAFGSLDLCSNGSSAWRIL